MVSMNEKSKVVNLCDFPISWKRITQIGDELLEAKSSTYINNAELEAQKDMGNVFISGTDRIGSHAKVFIENPELREQFGFDNKEEKRVQFILDDKTCEYIIGLKTETAFVKNIEDKVITESEKTKIIEYARKVKFNDYDKIKILEKHTGLKF